jgi:hypothetical protein
MTFRHQTPGSRRTQSSPIVLGSAVKIGPTSGGTEWGILHELASGFAARRCFVRVAHGAASASLNSHCGRGHVSFTARSQAGSRS